MMSCRVTVLDFAVIDMQDDTYRITTPTAMEDLSRSIRHVGLINPPILFQKQDRYVIVAGFQRIAVMQRLNHRQVPVQLMAPESSALERIRIAITDNISQRKLDLLETSRALALLSGCIESREQLSAEAQNLGLPGNHHHIQKIIGICHLPHLIQTGICRNRIALNMAFELQSFDETAGNLLAELFMALALNQNKQKEICSHLKEIAHLERKSVQEVMLSEGISEILADKDLDNLQKTRIVRSKLRKRRFPNLSCAEETFQCNLKKLHLGNRINLLPPDYFEGTSLKLSMSVKNEDELKEQVEILNKALSNPHLGKIFRSH